MIMCIGSFCRLHEQCSYCRYFVVPGQGRRLRHNAARWLAGMRREFVFNFVVHRVPRSSDLDSDISGMCVRQVVPQLLMLMMSVVQSPINGRTKM
jgi:hypothetical protein